MWIMTAQGWKQLSPRDCRPAGKDEHMVVPKKDDVDTYCRELRAGVMASRKMRGACMDCGYLSEPKRPVPGWRYCRCAKPQVFEAVAA